MNEVFEREWSIHRYGSRRQNGILTSLFHHLIHNVFVDHRYFDFGTSNEDAGRILNSGLIHQKTGLGGRGVAYQIFRLNPFFRLNP